MIDEGSFRDDLYHRLNGVVMHVPPLRERPEDLESLMVFFLENFNKKYQKNVKGFDAEVLCIFRRYQWPGNIRELRNCIERALVVNEGEMIVLHDLPDTMRQEQDPVEIDLHDQIGGFRDEYSRTLILQVLDRVGGNKSEAAKILGISRKTLYKWIHKLNIKHEYT